MFLRCFDGLYRTLGLYVRWVSYVLTTRTWRKIAVPIAVPVVAALIVAVILRLGGLLEKVLLRVWSGLSWIWELLYSSHPVPGGVILVLSLLALFGLAIVGLRLKELFQGEKKEQQVAGPTFQNYTEDSFDDVRWRWRWRGNQVDNLWCFCPRCDAQLVFREGYRETDFICERCPSDGTLDSFGSLGRVVTRVSGGDKQYAFARARREIDRRMRAGLR